MPRYYAPISVEALAQKILNAAYANRDYEGDYEGWVNNKPPEKSARENVEKHAYHLNLPYLTKTVEKDLAKVDFDTENLEAERGEGYAGCDLAGFHTYGLTFLGVTAGGDWECPLFFIIYWDGKQLRGYIPTAGNSWNTDNKKAYGNDWKDKNSSDAINYKKRYGVEIEESYSAASFSDGEMIDDIQKRIKPNNFPAVNSEPEASPAAPSKEKRVQSANEGQTLSVVLGKADEQKAKAKAKLEIPSNDSDAVKKHFSERMGLAIEGFLSMMGDSEENLQGLVDALGELQGKYAIKLLSKKKES